MDSAEAVKRLTSLRQYQGDGKRAPHKPLLVLLALAQFQKTGSSTLQWSDVEQRLTALLAEFGPPAKGGASPSYPFTRLRADGIWLLSRDVPDDTISPLRDGPMEGHFPAELEAALRRDPSIVITAARTLVDQQFPLTLAPDVLSAAGLDPDEVYGVSAWHTPVARRKRNAGWRDRILNAWDGACAFCGFDGRLGGGPVGIEAAHVRWFNLDGPDDLDNGLALCSLHHKLLDRGALGLSDPGTVMVSSSFNASSELGRRVYDLHGTSLRPRPGTHLPRTDYVEWHRGQVFKGEPLIA